MSYSTTLHLQTPPNMAQMQNTNKSWTVASGFILTALFGPVFSIIPFFFFSIPIIKAYYLRGFSFGCVFSALFVGFILVIIGVIVVQYCNSPSYYASTSSYYGYPNTYNHSNYSNTSGCYALLYVAAVWILVWSAVARFTFLRSKAMILAAEGAQPNISLQQQIAIPIQQPLQQGNIVYIVAPGQVPPAGQNIVYYQQMQAPVLPTQVSHSHPYAVQGASKEELPGYTIQ